MEQPALVRDCHGRHRWHSAGEWRDPKTHYAQFRPAGADPAATFFGLRAAPIRLNPVQQTGFCRVLWSGTVRSRVLGAATLFLVFELLAAASARAQEPQPS